MGRTRRVTLREAAQELGVSREAVRKRVQRGTLPSDVGEDGRRYVYLDAGPPAGDRGGRGRDPREELIATLRDQLEAERAAHAEARRIIAGLVERLPPAIEAAPRGERESPEGAGEEPTGTSPPPEPEGATSQPWWRRMFGG